MNVRSILEDLGYHIADDGDYYRTSAMYRGGSNRTALSVRKSDGAVFDFGTDSRYSIDQLANLTLGLDEKALALWMADRGGSEKSSYAKPKVEFVQKYPKECLKRLVQSHSFYTDKNISVETLEVFGGGLATKGKMDHRYVFPLYDENSEIIGWAGRDTTNRNYVKWKILGPKKHFVHPLPFSLEHILSSGEVILVESIGDMLSLWEAGIKNSLVLFGLSLQRGVFRSLVSINPHRILVATNNEPEKGQSGGSFAARKICDQLEKVFEKDRVIEALPTKSDFGEMDTVEILEWKLLIDKKGAGDIVEEHVS